MERFFECGRTIVDLAAVAALRFDDQQSCGTVWAAIGKNEVMLSIRASDEAAALDYKDMCADVARQWADIIVRWKTARAMVSVL